MGDIETPQKMLAQDFLYPLELVELRSFNNANFQNYKLQGMYLWKIRFSVGEIIC